MSLVKIESRQYLDESQYEEDFRNKKYILATNKKTLCKLKRGESGHSNKLTNAGSFEDDIHLMDTDSSLEMNTVSSKMKYFGLSPPIKTRKDLKTMNSGSRTKRANNAKKANKPEFFVHQIALMKLEEDLDSSEVFEESSESIQLPPVSEESISTFWGHGDSSFKRKQTVQSDHELVQQLVTEDIRRDLAHLSLPEDRAPTFTDYYNMRMAQLSIMRRYGLECQGEFSSFDWNSDESSSSSWTQH